MSNRNIILVILLALVLLGGLFYYYQQTILRRYNWEESGWFRPGYSEKSDEPYGTMAFHRLMETYFPDKKLTNIQSIRRQLPMDGKAHGNYIFVGETYFLDSISTDSLFRFVANGNTALIITKKLPLPFRENLARSLCSHTRLEDYEEATDTSALLSLAGQGNNTGVQFRYANQNITRQYAWHGINKGRFCDSLPARPLGYLNNNQTVNFFSVPHGKGTFLLHAEPLAFSNYSFQRKETRPYIAGVLSALEPGEVYWDMSNRAPSDEAAEEDAEHPLAYILEQPALAWAWYLMVALAFLWLLFGGKRRQRVIPVLAKNENSSYEFISTVAHLHFMEKNYRGISILRMKLFLAQIRERYGLVILMDNNQLPRIDDGLIAKLAAASELSETTVRSVFTNYANTVRYEPTEDMMVDLYFQMEEFLKKAS